MKRIILIFIMIGIHTICQAKSWMDYDAYIAPADGDYLLINDVDDDTDDASGTVKRLAWLYVQQRNANLTSLSTIAYSANMLSFLDAADYAAMRTLLAVLPLAGGIITGVTYFSDGDGDSPPLTFTDETTEYVQFHKEDAGPLYVSGDLATDLSVSLRNIGDGDMNFLVDGYISEGGTSLVSKYQGINAANLTPISALTSTAYGRSLLEFADEATLHANTCWTSQEAAGTINLGQEYCADGATWDPTGSGLTEDHIVMPTVDLGSDTYTWVLVRTNLGVQYFSGIGINTSTYGSGDSPVTLSAAEVLGGVIYVTSGPTRLIVPSVLTNTDYNFTVITVGTGVASIDPNIIDLIVLDGATTLDVGDQIDSTATTGDIAVCTYYSADGLYCATNGWSDGGAP